MRLLAIQYLKCAAAALSCACGPAIVPEAPDGADESRAADASDAGSDGRDGTDVPEGADASGPSVSNHPLLDDRQAEPEAALPRLNYKHLGMHIGGESNSAESKRPWFDDIERHEEELLYCYRFVSDPEKGGSYGVDLYVAKQGEPPEVRGSRQKLGGEEFDGCMRQAFSGIDFHRPERPTVFSYSIAFQLEE